MKWRRWKKPFARPSKTNTLNIETPILYKLRQSGELCHETVAGESGLRFLYQSPLGRLILEIFCKKPIFSAMMGLYQNSRLSRRDIPSFIEALGIKMSEAQKSGKDFKSFNEFFARKLKPEARPIEADPSRLTLPADGRILALPVLEEKTELPVKGAKLNLKQIIQDSSLYPSFLGGSALIVRLSPMDYHRFHWCFDGTPSKARRIAGHYYSVNPIAFPTRPELWSENERQITILSSETLGKVLQIEVGATFVGKIIQSFAPEAPVSKGQEKGYFLFGASTVILIFEPKKISLDPDLVSNTKIGYETLDFMGAGFATHKRNLCT